jgi:hypothetical protein
LEGTVAMTTTPRPPTLRVTGLADLLAVVPHLLGFHPDDSLVVLGIVHGRSA